MNKNIYEYLYEVSMFNTIIQILFELHTLFRGVGAGGGRVKNPYLGKFDIGEDGQIIF